MLKIEKGVLFFYSTITALLLAFFLGAYALEAFGVQYVTEGGFFVLKIHFYSYLILATFFYYFFKLRSGELTNVLGSLYIPWLALTFSVVWVIIYGLIRFGTSGMAYVVDTLLTPILLFPLVLSLTEKQKSNLIKIITALVIINSITALIEFLIRTPLWSPLYEMYFYFRSGAWFSHPLNNALIVASLTPILLATRIVNPFFMFSIVLISLFAFGARAATGLFIIFSGYALLVSLSGHYKKKGGLTHFNAIIYILAVLFLPMVIGFLVEKYDIGARIFNNLEIDASGQTRFDVYFVFSYLSLPEVLLGASNDVMLNIEYFIGNSVVENYIVGWILFYGLVGALPLIFFLFFFFLRIAINSNVYLRLSILSFVFISLTNNALTAKTPALLLLLLAIACSSQLKYRISGR